MIIPGIHHVTAIASSPQRNLDFYTQVLGLRLVKLTVNFDDPATHHFYYGDATGTPGTLLTFFPWVGSARRVRRGPGQITAVRLKARSLEAWRRKAEQAGVLVKEDREILLCSIPMGFPWN